MAFLDLIHINKRFSKFVAVEDFNLHVERGEFISFLGPSGCGKTTTLRMIAGFEIPTDGEILIEGADISNKAPNQRNVGMVFQSYALFPNMTVADNIGFGMKVAHKPAQEIKERIDEMLVLIQMAEFSARYPYQLSGGQQQRVALARALAIRPNVLLLDEPLSALDAKIRLELRNEIRTIQQKLGITTIYVTHDQEEALTLSDRVVVMRKGKIEQIGSPFEIYNFPKTHFVASFVGTLNFMEVKVKDAHEGLLEIESQTFRTAGPVEAVNGETILTAIRPELLSLEGDSETDNHFTCQVARITFLGSVVRIQVMLGEKLIFMDTFNNPHLVLPKEGDQVPVYFSKEAALVLHITD